MSATEFDAQRFREALGHYPTGVAVITGIGEDGEPAGMVVGSFTSVSLEPPLVGFLPMKSSGSFARMRTGTRFAVNVLGADQEELCNLFASRAPDKFAGVDWRPSPCGAPLLPDVVAWIECEYADIVDAGDHYFVLGAVTAMDIPRPALPLLFFQGGYGRFSPASLMALGEPSVFGAVRLAERIRTGLETVAAEFRADCSVIADVSGEVVFVSNAQGSADLGFITVGARIPLLAPFGAAFFVDRDQTDVDAWIARAPLPDDDLRAGCLADLDTIRRRGFSVALRSRARADTHTFERAVAAYTGGRALPAQERQLRRELSAMLATSEPEIEPADSYDVHSITVPITPTPGQPRVALRLSHLPRPATGVQVLSWAQRLLALAAEAGEAGQDG